MSELDLDRFESMKRYVGFDERAALALRELHPVAAPRFSAIIDDFYETIERHPEARQVITGGKAQIDRLKRTLVAWLESVLLGPHDLAYLEAHARIGRVHVRIELPQQLMFTAMNRIRVRLLEIVYAEYRTKPEPCLAIANAVNQILDLELAIMLETYRENYNEKIRSVERLATIGQLAASIGHELRNPLGIVDSSVYLIRQRLEKAGIDDAQINKHIDKILGQVRLSTKTVNNLLDLARNRPPAKRRVGLRSLVDHAIERSGVAPATAVEVNVAEELTIEVDPDDVAHTLINLLVNASHAQGGSGRVEISAQANKGGVEIRVRDDGPGVPPEIRKQIFEALFTTKSRGTGLGLALCRRIVYAHGGEMELEPSERGACFRIWFPQATAAA